MPGSVYGCQGEVHVVQQSRLHLHKSPDQQFEWLKQQKATKLNNQGFDCTEKSRIYGFVKADTLQLTIILKKIQKVDILSGLDDYKNES